MSFLHGHVMAVGIQEGARQAAKPHLWRLMVLEDLVDGGPGQPAGQKGKVLMP
jgi:hypothetical protein